MPYPGEPEYPDYPDYPYPDDPYPDTAYPTYPPPTPPTTPDWWQTLWADVGQDPGRFVAGIIEHDKLQPNEYDHTALQTIVDYLNKVGVNASLDTPDAQGRLGGIVVGGERRQLLGGQGWTSLQAWPTGGGGVDQTATASTAATGNLLGYPEFVPPDFNAPAYAAPAPFTYEDYAPLTAETFERSPGYEFSRNEALRAVKHDQSARGLLRTGGALKALESYATGLAQQDFAGADARSRQNYQMNRGGAADIYDRNYRNNLQNWMVGYNQEADEYNRALTSYGVNFGGAATKAGIGQTALDSLFGKQLSLYDLATRDLPKYTPTAPSPYGGYGGQ